MIKIYGYKKCSTCRNAEKFLKNQNLEYEYIDIVTNPPTLDILRKVFASTDKAIKKLINTNGQLYRELGLKDRVDNLSQEEIFKLLSENGKLIKRPIVFDGTSSTVGFREEEFEKIWT